MPLFKIISLFGKGMFFLEVFILLILLMWKKERRSYFILRLIACTGLGVLFKFLPAVRIGFISFSYFVVVAYVVAVAYLLFKAKLISCIFYTFSAWAGQHVAWNILTLFLDYVEMDMFGTIAVYIGFYAIVYGLIAVLSSHKRSVYEVGGEKVSVVILSVAVLFMTSIIHDLIDHYSDGWYPWTEVYSILTCIFILFVQFGVSERGKLKEENKILEAENVILEGLLYQSEKQHKLTGETIDIINRKCHDLKHQLQTLRTMSQEDREKYLDEIEEAVMVYGNIAKTGNYSLDVVLTEKSLLCEEYKIKFSYVIDGKQLEIMEAVDIASLFGNALDNAIECEIKEKEGYRIIRLNVFKTQGFLRICCENYCSHVVNFEEELPVTNKMNSHYHGFGVKSIKYITEKYGGALTIKQEDEFFNVTSLIPLTAKQE